MCFLFSLQDYYLLFKKPRIPSLPESSLHLLLNSQLESALSTQEVLLITPNTRPPNVLTVFKGISPFFLSLFFLSPFDATVMGEQCYAEVLEIQTNSYPKFPITTSRHLTK